MDRNLLIAAAILCMGTLPTAAADNASPLGTWKSWSAYSTTTGGKLVCYALAAPRATEPKGAKRSPVYFLVNDWPDRRARAEAEVVAGYPYKDDAAISVEIGSDKFTFFARGADGNAWIQSLADTQHLMDAMGKGVSMLVTGTSARGTVTRDTYSLDGFADALAKIHATCRM